MVLKATQPLEYQLNFVREKLHLKEQLLTEVSQQVSRITNPYFDPSLVLPNATLGVPIPVPTTLGTRNFIKPSKPPGVNVPNEPGPSKSPPGGNVSNEQGPSKSPPDLPLKKRQLTRFRLTSVRAGAYAVAKRQATKEWFRFI